MTTPIPPDEEIEALITELEARSCNVSPGAQAQVCIMPDAPFYLRCATALRSLSARNRAMGEALERQEVFIRTFMAAIDTFAPDTPDGHKLRIITTLGDLRALQRDRARAALSEQTTKPVETK